MEQPLIRERVPDGLRHAKAKGKQVGRPRRVLNRAEVVRLRDQERLSWPEIARRTGAGVGTVVRAYRALNGSVEPFHPPRAGPMRRAATEGLLEPVGLCRSITFWH